MKKSLPRKGDVWGFEHSEFMEDAINSAKEGLFLTDDDDKNQKDEEIFSERLGTILAIFNVKPSDAIIRGIRAKNAPAKGGRVAKKEPSFALLVRYAWEKSGRKTVLSMWKFLRKKLKEAELEGGKIIEGCDFIYEEKTNRFTLYFQDKRKPKDMGFRSFQRHISNFKKDLKKESQ
jgi:hypothetical protein